MEFFFKIADFPSKRLRDFSARIVALNKIKTITKTREIEDLDTTQQFQNKSVKNVQNGSDSTCGEAPKSKV
jgi:hypothetical protein